MRRTKLIATIGPSSQKIVTINQMIRKGADAFRLNFSHGTQKEKVRIIRAVRKISKKMDINTPLLADLQGNVMRIRCNKPVDIKEGRRYRIDYKKGPIYIEEKTLFKIVDKGDILLVDDGKIIFKVIDKSNEHIYVKSLINGKLLDRKKIIIKEKEITPDNLTPKDINDLEFSMKNNIEYIALSMVRTPNDIKILREYIEKYGGEPWVIAKIETPQGVKNINDICKISDGVMVARGDLGQYYPLEKIPYIQHKIVKHANRYGKISIIATQILESMITNEQPTRAEVTDIYQAVQQHVDAILLTAETAVGKYPVDAVKWASKILEEADKQHKDEPLFYEKNFEENIFDKFARGSIYMANLLNAIIISYTKKGNTAKRLSRYRPKRNIYVSTHDPYIANKISLLYGITSMLIPDTGDYMKNLRIAKEKLLEKGELKKGTIIIYTVGIRPEATDMLTVEII